MSNFREICRKLIIILLPALVISGLCYEVPVRASNDSEPTVRVGYYENEVFEEGASPDAVKTGYAYEYYRKLSEYTGWNYEYVYGSFGDLYDMLLSGDIDLLAGLVKREERIGIIGYPADPMGHEAYTLVKHDYDDSVTSSVASVSGRTIGVLNSAIVDILNDYLEAHSVEAEVVCFDDYESLFASFDDGSIDILAAEGDGAYGRDHAEVICTFGTSDYYLCVSIERPDLLAELDDAQSLLAVEEPNYIGTLQNKYYPYSVSSHSFSVAEKEWIENNSELKIGYLNNYLPYSDTGKNGEVTGIVKEIIPKICSELSVSPEVTYTGFDNYDDMITAVGEDRIDVAFPVGGGLYYSEASGIYQSSPVASASTDLVYRGEYREDDTREFAVNENNRMQYYYIRTHFPDADIVFYPDIDACLKAVLKGEVGATTLNGLRANEILKNSRYEGLYLQQLSKADDRCFGVKIGNEGLLKLLNRGIKILGAEYSHEIANRYSTELYSYTFSDMVKDNLWMFMIFFLLIAIFVIVLIIRDLKRTRVADRLKTDFVSNMSHEIRTPITAILGMNEMIQRESLDETILGYSDNIEKAGESLLGIISDILDFSKIESGRMELDEAPYSLPELLGDLNLMVIMRVEEKGLNFIIDVDENLPVMPVGDVQKLRQVITNFLTNAVKYTEKGTVKLTIKQVSRADESVIMGVSVEDTGIGIKPEEMGKLYSAFHRLDMERTRNIEGSGLGLTITSKLLALMGSDIKVQSEYGKGSCFSFEIRQGIADETPIGSFAAAGAGRDKRRLRQKRASFKAPASNILIVDDTPMNLQVICGLLKDNGMSIDTASSGEECISLFGENKYDAVFLDQRMPNLDGIETLAKLRELYPDNTAKTPVICLTANALAGGKEQMLKEGFTDYLTKPVNLYDMEQMLLKYLPAEKIIKTDADIAHSDPEPETQIPVKIGSIEELDIEKGIEYCGDEEELEEALKIYAASSAEKAGRIDELFEQASYEELSLLLHSVKSTSRAIGASDLADKAEKLEKAAKEENRDVLDGEISRFTDRYRDLGKSINEALV